MNGIDSWVKSSGRLGAMRNRWEWRKYISWQVPHCPDRTSPTSHTQATFTAMAVRPAACLFPLMVSFGFQLYQAKKKKKKICLLPRAQRSWKSQFHSAQIGGVSLIMERPRIPGPASSEWCEPAKQTQLSTADASGTEAGGGGTWVPSGISHQPSHRPHSGQSWPLGLQNLKKKKFLMVKILKEE